MKRARRTLKQSFAALVALPASQRARRLASLTAEEAAELYYDWTLWARPDQLPPPGDWLYWLILAGRGAGKTRAGAETVRAWVRSFPLVNLIGATGADAREIMVEGESGVLAVCPPHERPRFSRAAGRLDWPNGAISQIYSAEEPDRLRGKQHMKLWLDELAAWRDPDAFDQAMLGLRLGAKPQLIITTTPRPTKLIRQLLDDTSAVVTRGSTFDNAKFLADGFLTQIAACFDGRALGRQELYGEIVEEAPGALWTRALIEKQRLPNDRPPVDYAEIVVGVDPPARSGAKGRRMRHRRGRAHAGRTSFTFSPISQAKGETPGRVVGTRG